METMIQVRDLRKTYRMGEIDVPALRGVSFQIRRGEFVAIMGPSGSGKSTLMNLLGCLDTPTAGQYILDGLPVEQLDRNLLAAVRNRKIGFVFQQFNLLPRQTALENVALPLVYLGGVAAVERQAHAQRVLTVHDGLLHSDGPPAQLSSSAPSTRDRSRRRPSIAQRPLFVPARRNP